MSVLFVAALSSSLVEQWSGLSATAITEVLTPLLLSTDNNEQHQEKLLLWKTVPEFEQAAT